MKRVCPTCKTTKFKSSSDGGLVCKYGHKILGVQIEEQEDDMGGGGRQRKRIKILRDNMQKANPAKQKSDFLLIFQYTLQVLTRCMVQELDFPPEIEPVVRELWLLYLADSKQELLDAYLFEANEKEFQDSQVGGRKLDFLQKIEKDELELDDLHDSSSSEDDDEHQDKTTEKRKGSIRTAWPKLRFKHTLVFIYLGCIYLNYPVLPNDLIRWSTTGQIPYLNMQQKIPVEILGSLYLTTANSMTITPKVSSLIRYNFKFSSCLSRNCNIVFPVLNIPLYLDRFCCQYFLPVEGYYYANYIFELYRKSHAPHLSLTQHFSKTQVTTILMACVIATVKLIYGVDDYKSDFSSVSQFDTSTTKETWLNQISNNLSRWKSLKDDKRKLKNLVQYLQSTSVAAKASANLRDKHNALLNILNREPSNIKYPISSAQVDALLDSSDLVIESSSNDEDKPLINQGEFYYSRKDSFAPKNYLQIVSLATIILGESSNANVENTVKMVDQCILKYNSSTSIPAKKYNLHYK